jgi:polyhydroxyalkanoate synthesis repressor PhaR
VTRKFAILPSKVTYFSNLRSASRCPRDFVRRIQYDADVTVADQNAAMAEERIIRKYANRRLYDSAASRHVTLDDVRRLIGAGERVKVVEDKSGEDITRSILLQIISAQEQFGTPVLSTQLLEALIRFYGNPVQEMLTKYLEQSIGSLLRQQQVMRAEMAKVLESPMAPMADLARQNMELWAKLQASMLSTFSPAAATPQPKPAEPSAKPHSGKRRG